MYSNVYMYNMEKTIQRFIKRAGTGDALTDIHAETLIMINTKACTKKCLTGAAVISRVIFDVIMTVNATATIEFALPNNFTNTLTNIMTNKKFNVAKRNLLFIRFLINKDKFCNFFMSFSPF